MLKWDQTDVLTCLEVEPETDVENYGLYYGYTVFQGDLSLKLAIWPMDGDIIIDLFHKDIHEALTIITLIDCPEIRYIKEDTQEYLEFSAGLCQSNRSHSTQKNNYGIRLSIKPSLQIKTFQADHHAKGA